MSDPHPLHLGGDAWLIRALPEGDEPLRLPLNSLVLRGAETVLVDTGPAAHRRRWWEEVDVLVPPDDVRWLFLSHDDVDASGNLGECLDRCPQATVLTSWPTAQRLLARGALSAERCRWVGDGEHVTIGDRRLFALRPPAYDSSGTLGLFDPVSAVYWAADCFGSPVPHLVADAAELDTNVWTDGFLSYHRLLSPWAAEIEPLRWRAAVGRVAALGARVLASTHGPAIRGPLLGRALDLLAEVPAAPAPTAPAGAGHAFGGGTVGGGRIGGGTVDGRVRSRLVAGTR